MKEKLIDRSKIDLDKTPNDLERETTLLEQLVRLAEERNFAELPPPGSGIPGDFIMNRINDDR